MGVHCARSWRGRLEDRRDYWQTSPTVTMLKGLLFVSVNPRASESPGTTLKV